MRTTLNAVRDRADDCGLHLSALGSRIRELRSERNLTLSQLSLKSQISIGMLSHIERGKTSPSLKTLERLRLALDTTLASFFGSGDTRASENGVVVRVAQRPRLPFDRLGLTKEL